jgi:hypothetical protein
LDAEAFEVRQRAAAELEKLGEAAAPALAKLRDGPASPEVRRRARSILEKLNYSPEIRSARAVAALEYSGTPEARRLLEGLAKDAAEPRLAAEARAALDRMKRPPASKP